MDAGQVLDSLRGRGLQVSLEGDALKIGPKAAVTPEVRVEAKAHKAELIARLREEQLAALVDAIDAAETAGDAEKFTELVRQAKQLALICWPHRADTIPAIGETLPAVEVTAP
jgi:hypothetical protein